MSSEDVKKIILSISKNAVGCDSISRRMIVTILDLILTAIAYIINFFSELWNLSLNMA